MRYSSDSDQRTSVSSSRRPFISRQLHLEPAGPLTPSACAPGDGHRVASAASSNSCPNFDGSVWPVTRGSGSSARHRQTSRNCLEILPQTYCSDNLGPPLLLGTPLKRHAAIRGLGVEARPDGRRFRALPCTGELITDLPTAKCLQNLSKNRVAPREPAWTRGESQSGATRCNSRTLATKDERHRQLRNCRLLEFDSRQLHSVRGRSSLTRFRSSVSVDSAELRPPRRDSVSSTLLRRHPSSTCWSFKARARCLGYTRSMSTCNDSYRWRTFGRGPGRPIGDARCAWLRKACILPQVVAV